MSARGQELLYGHGPHILVAPALAKPVPIARSSWSFADACHAAKKPMLYTAGLFNTGTNFAFEFLRLKHCVKGGKRMQVPINWQAEYSRTPKEMDKKRYVANRSQESFRGGKHTYLRVIQEKYNPRWSHSSVKEDGGFVLVIVRHPLSWIPSMCKRAYVCDIGRRRTHGEDDLAGTGRVAKFTVDNCMKGVLDRPVHCRDTRGHDHKNLARLWADWYDAYAGPHWLPRVFVRYEDLLLHPHIVLLHLCPCIGASVVEDLNLEDAPSLKDGRSPGTGKHRNGTSSPLGAMGHSIAKACAVDEVLRPYSAADLTTLRSSVGDTLRLFGYRIPPASLTASRNRSVASESRTSRTRNVMQTLTKATGSLRS
jgi:hypothetical protein